MSSHKPPLPYHAPKMSAQDTETSFETNYTGPVIPPHTAWRTLVLCFDGTGDEFDQDNSNIVLFTSLLKKGDISQQMVYYQTGIGTYTLPQVATPIRAKFHKTVDLMFATSLDAHVMGGYEFLMQNYKDGDKICIFGFSRGAYTARALAGMIHKVGLLPTSNHQQVPFAYRMFKQDDAQGWSQSILFKKTFAIDVDIEFLGVWDTVASVGIFSHTLPFTRSNTSIKVFRHALALDEHRVKFKPNLYHYPAPNEVDNIVAANKKTRRKSYSVLDDLKKFIDHEDDEHKKRKLEEMYTNRSKPTDVLEVWFAGCHCDVGGGSVANDTPHSLARIPLRWMIRQCFLANTGIQFEAFRLREVGLDPNSLFPVVRKRPEPLPISHHLAEGTLTNTVKGHHKRWSSQAKTLIDNYLGDGGGTEVATEEEHDLLDSLSRIYDQLSEKKVWWALELLPLRDKIQTANGTIRKFFAPNFGRPRIVGDQKRRGINVHRTVKMRMDAKDMKYRPRLKIDVTPTWVD